MSNKLASIKKNNPAISAKPRGTNRTPKSVTAKVKRPFTILDERGSFYVNAGDTMTLTADGDIKIKRQAVKPEPPVERRACCHRDNAGKDCGATDRLFAVYSETIRIPAGATSLSQIEHTGDFQWVYWCFEHQDPRPEMSEDELVDKVFRNKEYPPDPPYQIEVNEQREGNAFIKTAGGRYQFNFDLPTDKAERIVTALNKDYLPADQWLETIKQPALPPEPPTEKRACSVWDDDAGPCGSTDNLIGEYVRVSKVDGSGILDRAGAMKWVYTCAAHRERESAQAATQ